MQTLTLENNRSSRYRHAAAAAAIDSMMQMLPCFTAERLRHCTS